MKTPDDEIGGSGDARDPLPARVWMVRAGLICLAVGLLSFLSTFVVFAANFGKFDHFEERGRMMSLLAVSGFILIVVGMGLTMAGGSGVASAVWHLDPRRAKERLAPWARLSGQLSDEAFSEMKTVRQTLAGLGSDADAPTERIVQVRCRTCRALNEETDKFCGQCGQAL